MLREPLLSVTPRGPAFLDLNAAFSVILHEISLMLKR